MKPSIGRIVIYRFPEADRIENGGEMEAPAIITKVWSPEVVNLMVIADGSVCHRTSVSMGLQLGGWSWPERV